MCSLHFGKAKCLRRMLLRFVPRTLRTNCFSRHSGSCHLTRNRFKESVVLFLHMMCVSDKGHACIWKDAHLINPENLFNESATSVYRCARSLGFSKADMYAQAGHVAQIAAPDIYKPSMMPIESATIIITCMMRVPRVSAKRTYLRKRIVRGPRTRRTNCCSSSPGGASGRGHVHRVARSIYYKFQK